MEIANHVQEVIRAFGGIKSSLPQGALTVSDAEDCVNFISRRLRLRKLWGTDLVFTSGAGNGPVQWIDRLQNLWLVQHGTAMLREHTEGQNDFQQDGEILLGEQNPARSAKWENRLFLSNGVENKFFEYTRTLGWSYLTLGLTPPNNGTFFDENLNSIYAYPSATKVPAPLAPSSPADATYSYLITWWDSVREVESLPHKSFVGEDGLWLDFSTVDDPSVAAFTGMAGNNIRVDISSLKARGYDSRVTHFIVYRATQADSTVFKRILEPTGAYESLLRIANDYVDDFVTEANLGTVADFSISPPPSGKYYSAGADVAVSAPASYGPRFVEQFRDQLWLFGVRFPGTALGLVLNDAGDGTRATTYQPQSGIAYASDVGNPDYWKYTWDVGKSTGQEDTGMATHGNTLMFFKSRSAYRLLGTDPDNYEVQCIDQNRGFTVPGSVRKTAVGVIGLGEEGFTLFDGNGPGQLISDELYDYVKRINLEHAEKIASAYDGAEERYECSVPLDEATHNTHVFSFDCKSKTWSVTRRAFGAAAYDLWGKKSVSLLGGRQNGRLYSASDYSKVTLDGETMHGKWRSKAFDFGLPGELKNVQMVEITARAVTDFRLSIDLIMDFGQGDTASVEDHPPNLRGDVWAEDADDTDGMNWDHGQWSKGAEKKKFTILIQGIGKNFNLIIRNSDRDAGRASFEIEEVVIHASRLSGDNDD